ncbi:MAG: hypothetical protein AABY22_08755 [Nanoarchaeota archaeon]
MTKERFISFEEFDNKCKEISLEIKKIQNIKYIYGISRGGVIPATRISYLLNIPIVFLPQESSTTVIIDDVVETGATRMAFQNYPYFFALFKRTDDIYIKFWWELT